MAILDHSLLSHENKRLKEYGQGVNRRSPKSRLNGNYFF